MKILKSYPSGQKHIEYSYSDGDLIKKRLKIDDETTGKLLSFMEKNHQTLLIKDLFDPCTEWNGAEVWLMNSDLSEGGYSFTQDKLNAFLREKGV